MPRRTIDPETIAAHSRPSAKTPGPWHADMAGVRNVTTVDGARHPAADFMLDIWPPNGKIDACESDDCFGDYNADGVEDQDDVACLQNQIAGGTPCYAFADPDFNNDGVADQDDVAALITVVAGGPCP